VRRMLIALAAAFALVGCSSKTESVRLASGCDGPDGSCARYLRTADSDGAPLERATVVVPFTGAVRVAEKASGLSFVTASFNLESRANDLRLVPLKAIRTDAQNPQQLVMEVEGLLADGAAIDLPDGLVQDSKGRKLGQLTVKVKTGLSPFSIGLAASQIVPGDMTLFDEEHTQKPTGPRDEAKVREELDATLHRRVGLSQETINGALAKFDGDPAKKKIPEARLRAALLALTGTTAEGAIDAVLADTNRRGYPFLSVTARDLGRGALAAVFFEPLSGQMRMFFDTAFVQEPLEVLAPTFAHESVHGSGGSGSASEETIAMAFTARIYEELLIANPEVALQPTSGIRFMNRLVLAMRNSGHFSFPRAGLLARPGVENALQGVFQPARSFKDMLFKPDYYGELPKATGTGTEVTESYVDKLLGKGGASGRVKFGQDTLKLLDAIIDNGLTDEQVLVIMDALRLKPAPRAGEAR
jgi:hypothetical protein